MVENKRQMLYNLKFLEKVVVSHGKQEARRQRQCIGVVVDVPELTLFSR